MDGHGVSASHARSSWGMERMIHRTHLDRGGTIPFRVQEAHKSCFSWQFMDVKLLELDQPNRSLSFQHLLLLYTAAFVY